MNLQDRRKLVEKFNTKIKKEGKKANPLGNSVKFEKKSPRPIKQEN